MVNENTLKLFSLLVKICEEKEIPWSLRYEQSFTVSGEHTMDAEGNMLMSEDVPEEHRKYNEGYTIMVNYYGLNDEDGDNLVHETINEALITGIKILTIMAEDGEL